MGASKYVHTYIHTYIYRSTHIPQYIQTYMHTYLIEEAGGCGTRGTRAAIGDAQAVAPLGNTGNTVYCSRLPYPTEYRTVKAEQRAMTLYDDGCCVSLSLQPGITAPGWSLFNLWWLPLINNRVHHHVMFLSLASVRR